MTAMEVNGMTLNHKPQPESPVPKKQEPESRSTSTPKYLYPFLRRPNTLYHLIHTIYQKTPQAASDRDHKALNRGIEGPKVLLLRAPKFFEGPKVLTPEPGSGGSCCAAAAASASDGKLL